MNWASQARALSLMLLPDAPLDGFQTFVLEAGLEDLRAKIAPVAPLAEERSEPEAIAPRSPTRPRLLAAEDNQTNQLVFKTMLKGLNLDLEIVENGQELLDAYKAAPPDLVMTDISMPGMDGIEATRLIRAFEAEKDLPPCPIIAMTAHALEGDRVRILEAGLDDYVTKPLKKTVIQDRVLNALPAAGDQGRQVVSVSATA